MYRELFSCAGKVALVTGGAGLLGSEISKGLLDMGAKVYIADSDRQKAVTPEGESRMSFLDLDITSDESIAAGLDAILEAEGRIDVLVNSAYPRTPDWGLRFEDIPIGSWNTNVSSHLGGYFLCCRAAAERMRSHGGGSIISLASIYGVVAPDFSIYAGTSMTMPAAYAAIKGGVIALTRYLSTYYAPYNIRANAVSPGGVFQAQPDCFVESYRRKTPLGRMATPSDIVGGVIYLASDASRYVTGQNLIIDGGWTVW